MDPVKQRYRKLVGNAAWFGSVTVGAAALYVALEVWRKKPVESGTGGGEKTGGELVYGGASRPMQNLKPDPARVSSGASSDTYEANSGEDECNSWNELNNGESNFFAMSKFFSCIGLDDSRALYEAAETIEVAPNQMLFRQGDDSESGVFLVVKGTVGVFLQEGGLKEGGQKGAPARLTNILRESESVGDIDVLDGHPRSVSCTALEEGAVVVRVTRKLFLDFIMKHPQVLHLYLQQAIARLWRVAHFVLNDFLQMRRKRGVCSERQHPRVQVRRKRGVCSERQHPRVQLPRKEQSYSVLTATCDVVPVEEVDKFVSSLRCMMQPCSESGSEPAAPPPSTSAEFHPPETSPAANPAGGKVEHPVDVEEPSTSSGQESAPEERAHHGLHAAWVEAARKVHLRHAQELYTERSPAQHFFLLDRGRLIADPVPWPAGDGTPAPPLEQGSLVGCAAFLTRTPRRETMRAAETCVLLMFGAEELEKLREADLPAYTALMLAVSRSLTPLIRQFISLGLNRVWLTAGDTAYEHGAPASSLFIVISGRLVVSYPPPAALPMSHSTSTSGSNAHGAMSRNYSSGTWGSKGGPGMGGGGGRREEIGRGETLGEVSLLAGAATRHEATAQCVRDTEMVRMSRSSFQLICSQSPSAAARLLEVMAIKLRGHDAGRHQPKELATIALIPASSAGGRGRVHEFAQVLQGALQAFGPTLHLSAEAVAPHFPDDTLNKLHTRFYRSKLTSWMAQQEENFRFILLEGDMAHHALWTRICVTQADLVVVVADTSCQEQAAPHPAERRLMDGWKRRQGAATELVLLHPPGKEPVGTRTWREGRGYVRRHHHVRADVAGDVLRLARHIAGKSVGLVLSGGGSRGLAHLGVIRALEDCGVPIDIVGGTSEGAFIAGLYALKAGSQSMMAAVRRHVEWMSSARHLLLDLTLPLLSIFSGSHFEAALRESLGANHIEDLCLPFFCTTCNLSTGRQQVHESGLLWKYVRASMTVLGILPPVFDEGNLLVDGGYLNTLPVDVMCDQMGAGTVIAVDVMDKEAFIFKRLAPFDGGLSGWRLLWERWNPFSGVQNKTPRYNELVETLMHAVSVRQGASMAEQYRIALFLRPPQPNYARGRFVDNHGMDRITRSAYRHTMKEVMEWQSTQREQSEGKRSQAAPGSVQVQLTAQGQSPQRPSEQPHTEAAQSEASSNNTCMSQLVAKCLSDPMLSDLDSRSTRSEPATSLPTSPVRSGLEERTLSM
ncbi:hypothetical protein CYMTET_35114 [Cymbomonas tetramitiformis]|uniref:Patatin n=1 Tax=Cymbomonas tetramitiformis TaxID=36881 RepID=A0AAE0F9V0_9CHLO|nr:hypothetical protein CYMTET_35114 [Cymbomonas tetramitiformis]